MLNCNKCQFKHNIAGDAHVSCSRVNTKLSGVNQHGVNSGWFMFPLNFDPCWAEACDAFVPKDLDIEKDENLLVLYKLESLKYQAKRNEMIARTPGIFSKLINGAKIIIKENPLDQELKEEMKDLIIEAQKI
jgi:hypothetical protein